MTIGKRIKMVRKSRKMSQAEFAKYIGMGQSTLALLEVDKRTVMERHIKMICATCGVSEPWLRTGDGEMLDDSNLAALIGNRLAQGAIKPEEEALMRSYLALPNEQRNVILDALHAIGDLASGGKN